MTREMKINVCFSLNALNKASTQLKMMLCTGCLVSFFHQSSSFLYFPIFDTYNVHFCSKTHAINWELISNIISRSKLLK